MPNCLACTARRRRLWRRRKRFGRAKPLCSQSSGGPRKRPAPPPHLPCLRHPFLPPPCRRRPHPPGPPLLRLSLHLRSPSSPKLLQNPLTYQNPFRCQKHWLRQALRLLQPPMQTQTTSSGPTPRPRPRPPKTSWPDSRTASPTKCLRRRRLRIRLQRPWYLRQHPSLCLRQHPRRFQPPSLRLPPNRPLHLHQHRSPRQQLQQHPCPRQRPNRLQLWPAKRRRARPKDAR